MANGAKDAVISVPIGNLPPGAVVGSILQAQNGQAVKVVAINATHAWWTLTTSLQADAGFHIRMINITKGK